MVSLLSLANSESHNFTAEILLRNASKTWDTTTFTKKMYEWSRTNNIPITDFVFIDGSGLSRKNRATTIGIASLLWHMDQHEHSQFYKSSMAIWGTRGTLAEFSPKSQITGNFFGKTGTLTGVRAISGILNTPYNVRYVSIINNGNDYSDTIIRNVLERIYKYSSCT